MVEEQGDDKNPAPMIRPEMASSNLLSRYMMWFTDYVDNIDPVDPLTRDPALTTPAEPLAGRPPAQAGAIMASLEPPNMGVLKDKMQLEFYITALERWSTIASFQGTADDIQADLVLTHTFNHAPDLCREMSEHFGNNIQDSKGVKKIIEWLKSKFGMNKHVDMVKILNN